MSIGAAILEDDEYPKVTVMLQICAIIMHCSNTCLMLKKKLVYFKVCIIHSESHF